MEEEPNPHLSVIRTAAKRIKRLTHDADQAFCLDIAERFAAIGFELKNLPVYFKERKKLLRVDENWRSHGKLAENNVLLVTDELVLVRGQGTTEVKFVYNSLAHNSVCTVFGPDIPTGFSVPRTVQEAIDSLRPSGFEGPACVIGVGDWFGDSFSETLDDDLYGCEKGTLDGYVKALRSPLVKALQSKKDAHVLKVEALRETLNTDYRGSREGYEEVIGDLLNAVHCSSLKLAKRRNHYTR